MRQAAFSFALAATLFASPATAVEMSAETRRDVICLIVFADAANGSINQSDVEDIGFGSILGYFYGKIFSRDPDLDLKAALTPEILVAARGPSDAILEACTVEAKNFADKLLAAAEMLDK